MRAVLLVQPGSVHIEAVAVFHGELAHADQPGAWARVVAPFGLDVVDEARQLAVAADLLSHQVGDHLFVGHCQHHIAVRLILEAPHLRADLVPAPGFLPDVRRIHHRHRDLLPANHIHLLADDVLDLRHRTSRQRQVAEDARCQLADKARPHQQLVAGDLRLGGRIAQRLSEKLCHTHRRPPKPLTTNLHQFSRIEIIIGENS